MLTGKQVSCIILIRVKEKPKNKKRIQKMRKAALIKKINMLTKEDRLHAEKIIFAKTEKKEAPAKKAPAKKITATKFNLALTRKKIVAGKKVDAKKSTAKSRQYLQNLQNLESNLVLDLKKVTAKTLKTPDTMSEKTMLRLNIDPKKRILDLLELEKIGARFEKTEKKAPAKIEKKAVKKIEKIEKMEKKEKIFSLEKKGIATGQWLLKRVYVAKILDIQESLQHCLKKIEIKRIENGIKLIYAEV